MSVLVGREGFVAIVSFNGIFSMPQFGHRTLTLATCLIILCQALTSDRAAGQSPSEEFRVTAQWDIDVPMRPYPDADRIVEYRISKDGAVARQNETKPVTSVSDEIERLSKNGDLDVVMFAKPNVRAGDFLRTYAAFNERLAGRLRFGGLEHGAFYATTEDARLDVGTLKRLGKTNSFRHFVYVRSDARSRCDIYLNVRPTDSKELLRSAQDLDAHLRENEPQPYRLTLFVDPQADYRCFAGTVYNLLFSGFNSFSVKLVEQTTTR